MGVRSACGGGSSASADFDWQNLLSRHAEVHETGDSPRSPTTSSLKIVQLDQPQRVGAGDHLIGVSLRQSAGVTSPDWSDSCLHTVWVQATVLSVWEKTRAINWTVSSPGRR